MARMGVLEEPSYEESSVDNGMLLFIIIIVESTPWWLSPCTYFCQCLQDTTEAVPLPPSLPFLQIDWTI